jgi:hypothetical protein
MMAFTFILLSLLTTVQVQSATVDGVVLRSGTSEPIAGTAVAVSWKYRLWKQRRQDFVRPWQLNVSVRSLWTTVLG